VTRGEPPALTASLTAVDGGGRSWVGRVRPLGNRLLSLGVTAATSSVACAVDVEEIADDDGGDDAPPSDGGSDGAPAVAFPGVASCTLSQATPAFAWRACAGDRAGGAAAGPFARVGCAVARTLTLGTRAQLRVEPYAAIGHGAPLRDGTRPEAVRAPRPAERAPWGAARKDALSDAFEGPLAGALLEVRAPVRDVTVLLFAEAAAAADLGDGAKSLVADAAYGVAFQANILRVDLAKRVGAFSAKPAITLRLADAGAALRCP